MDFEVFKERYASASSVVDWDKLRKEEERVMCPNPIDVGRVTRSLLIGVEELSELLVALANFEYSLTDKLKLIEEIADVWICLDYVSMVTNVKYYKLIPVHQANMSVTSAKAYLLQLQQDITKYLRGKGCTVQLEETASWVTNALCTIASYAWIKNSEICKAVNVKLERLTETELYYM